MRAIDGDALIDKYGDWYTEEGTEEGYIGTIKGIVDSMPTIEPERKTGKWTEVDENEYWGMWYRCSECGKTSIRGNFCPNCGVDMRENSEYSDDHNI